MSEIPLFTPTAPLPFTLPDPSDPRWRRSNESPTTRYTRTIRLSTGEEVGVFEGRRLDKNHSFRIAEIYLDQGAIIWQKRANEETLEIRNYDTNLTYLYTNKNGKITYEYHAGSEKFSLTAEQFQALTDPLTQPIKNGRDITESTALLPSATANILKPKPPSVATKEVAMTGGTQHVTTDGSCTIIREPLGDKPLTYCDKQPILKKDFNPHTRFRPDAMYQAGDEVGRKTIAANFKNDPALQKTLPPDVLEQLVQNIQGGITVLVEHQPAAPVRTAKTTPNGGKQH